MHTTTLRKVGGPMMVAVPPVIREILPLGGGAKASSTVNDGRLAIASELAPHDTLEELLAGSDHSRPRSAEEQQWLDAPPVGRELL